LFIVVNTQRVRTHCVGMADCYNLHCAAVTPIANRLSVISSCRAALRPSLGDTRRLEWRSPYLGALRRIAFRLSQWMNPRLTVGGGTSNVMPHDVVLDGR